MKKFLLLLIIAAFSTFIMVSCKEDVILANPDGTGKTNNPGGTNGNNGSNTKKCYLNEMVYTSDEVEYKTIFKYNSQNLLESKDEDGDITNYEYDSNGLLTKMVINSDGKETFQYQYDAKGNITKVKYDAQNTFFSLSFSEYIYTTNAKGLVEKIQGVSEEGNLDFIFEYDNKSNIKKVMVDIGTGKQTVLENISFDDKSNVFLNSNISKHSLPLIIAGVMFGENMTYYYNSNNITSSSALVFFSGEMESLTYKYEYTPEGFPSKMTATRKSSSETYNEQETYTYNCK